MGREPRGYETHIFVIVALYPRYQAECGQDLRLDLESNIEVFSDIVGAQRNTCTSPQKHHRSLQTNCVMPSEVDDYLRDKLYYGGNISTMIPGIGTDGALHIAQ